MPAPVLAGYYLSGADVVPGRRGVTLVAQERGGSPGALQLRGVGWQRGDVGPGDDRLFDGALDEHLAGGPTQCLLGVRVEQGRVGRAAGRDDQVADTVVGQAVHHLRPADRRGATCESVMYRLLHQRTRLLDPGLLHSALEPVGDRRVFLPQQVRFDDGDYLSGYRFGQLLAEAARTPWLGS